MYRMAHYTIRVFIVKCQKPKKVNNYLKNGFCYYFVNVNLHRKEGACKFDSFAHVTFSEGLGIRSNVFNFPSIFSSSFVTPSVEFFANIFCLNYGTF